MRNFIAFCLLLVSISALPAIAVDDGQVKYIGGTAPGVSAGVIGRLDTTPATALTFSIRETSWQFLTTPSSHSATRQKCRGI
jgi:hypothetical protein